MDDLNQDQKLKASASSAADGAGAVSVGVATTTGAGSGAGGSVAVVNVDANGNAADAVPSEAQSLLELADDRDLMSLSQAELEHFAKRHCSYEGFRLERVDVYNWGSFNNNVKSVYFGGQNVLMTGDNGAGKSSIIDAITVLLYDSQKIVFNQAAGADKNERNLASYVLGLYKNDNSTGVKTEMGLRSHQKAVLSVIMASFYNRNLDEHVVLIQCLVMTKGKGNSPDRHYYISQNDFNLANDILPVKDIKELGQKLRKIGAVNYSKFRDYYSQMQRLFGIEGTKVLDLFYKTISMKSIDNISMFVRKQMLEDFNGDALVDDIIERFNDLDASYRLVEEAKKQVEALTPIVEKGQEFANKSARLELMKQCQHGLGAYMSVKKVAIFKRDLEQLKTQLDKIDDEIRDYSEQIERVNAKKMSLHDELNAQGGNRREAILQEIRMLESERKSLYERYQLYFKHMNNLGLDPVLNEKVFNDLPKKLDKIAADFKKKEDEYRESYMRNAGLYETESKRRNEVENELSSLSRRKNNIPSHLVEVRDQICKALGCNETDLPFAGELMQVKAAEKERWEYAIERVLRGFATSMLVPEAFYRDVVTYVHTHNLGTHFVFYRIKEDEQGIGNNNNVFASAFKSAGLNTVGSNSLARKIDIKNDLTFYTYLRNTLERSYNYVCTDDEQEYRREKYALMSSGLYKRGGRNEKDDRKKRGSNDYVLGWSNEEKIAALRNELQLANSAINSISMALRDLDSAKNSIAHQKSGVDHLRDYKSFSDIDYSRKDLDIQKLKDELEELKRSSSVIESLTKRLEELEEDHASLNKRKETAISDKGMISARISQTERELDTARDFAEPAQSLSDEVVAHLEEHIARAIKVLFRVKNADEKKIETNSECDIVSREIDSVLQRLVRQEDENINVLSQHLVSLQSNFTNRFVVQGRHLDSTRAVAWTDFKNFKDSLEQDDLPRFVEVFKDKLSRDTLDQFATLHATFNSNCRKIEERIRDINTIMYEVDFNPNHYIQMVATETNDIEIKQFRQDLKNCTSNIMGDMDIDAADRKFFEVKALIDRFKGEVNGADIDGRWRKKVTDVKEWFYFSASERSREDDSEVDYYEDSGGKSGGQKEKLAYTVLASSLAYQYRSKARRIMDSSALVVNDDGTVKDVGSNYNYSYLDRSYRFVVIDEAFGRGSPQSVDYALTLFGKFNLQLLVATPMQKLDIIEKYVNHVAFVYRDESTNESTVFNYELQDYILKRKLKEQISRAPLRELSGGRVGTNPESDPIKAMTKEEAELALSRLDSKMALSQSSYAGPSIMAKQSQAQDELNPKTAGEGKSDGKDKGDAKAKVEDNAEQKVEQKAKQKSDTKGKHGELTHALDSTHDVAEVKDLELKDSDGKYLSSDEYQKRQNEASRQRQSKKTKNALSNLDLLDAMFVDNGGSLAQQDSVEDDTVQVVAPVVDSYETEQALGRLDQGLDALLDGVYSKVADDIAKQESSNTKSSYDSSVEPEVLEPSSKASERKKAQDEEEKHYKNSLEDLLEWEEEE